MGVDGVVDGVEWKKDGEVAGMVTVVVTGWESVVYGTGTELLDFELKVVIGSIKTNSGTKGIVMAQEDSGEAYASLISK